MKTELMKKIEHLTALHRLDGAQKRIVLFAALIVLLTALNIAVLSAYALDKEPVCGMEEHAHSDACYEIQTEKTDAAVICAPSVHSHGAECLNTDGVIVCGTADYLLHTHNEFCRDENGTLICTLSEISGEPHTHTDSCKNADGVIVCGKLSVSAHNHTAACISPASQTEKKVTICGLEEHSHSDTCYSSDGTEQKPSENQNSSENTAQNPEKAPAASSSDSDLPPFTGSLLMSAPAPIAEDDSGEIALTLGVTGEIDIKDGGGQYICTFTVPYDHDYTITYNRSFSSSSITYKDTEGNSYGGISGGISNNYKNTFTAAPAGRTYVITLNAPSSATEDSTASFTVNYADSGHIFNDGVCCCGLEVSTLNGTCGPDAFWKFEDGKLTIYGSGKMSYYSKNTLPWRNILEHITSIEVQDGITELTGNLANSCKNLKNVSLADSVTSIGNSAFYYCESLEEITLPSSLRTLDSNAFAYCSSLKEITLPDSLRTLGSSAFYKCTSLHTANLAGEFTSVPSSAFNGCTALTNVVFHENITSIGSSAFENCRALSELNLPESLKTISSYAFRYCSNIKDVTLPKNVTTVSTQAFYVSNAPKNTVTLDCSALNTADGFPANTVKKLIIGKNVDTLTTNFLTNSKFLTTLSELEFNGPNYFEMSADLSACNLFPYNAMKSGSYYVDSNGVVYMLDKENHTAALVHVPKDITNFTVPASVPAEEENAAPYPVNRIKSNALYLASDLTTLTFAAPENIVALESAACGNCLTLTSVNGKTTANDALALFTNPDAFISASAFFNTGLTSNSERTDDSIILTDNSTDLIPLITLITSKNKGTYNPDFADTYTNYTGEQVQVTLNISNSSAPEYEAVRIYFAFDGTDPYISWPLGENDLTTTDKSTVYTVNLVESDVDNIYYLEVERLKEGDTISANLVIAYPSPNSSGGTAKIWTSLMTAEDLENVGNGITHAPTYNEVEWVTKPDTFPISKSSSLFGSKSPFIMRNPDGDFCVCNLRYNIKMSRQGDTLTGVGKDHMTSVDFTDVITLPEGLYWDPDVIEAIRNGDWFPSGSSVCVTVDGETVVLCSISTVSGVNLSNISVSLTEDDNIEFHWTENNTKANKSEISSLSTYISFYNSKISDGLENSSAYFSAILADENSTAKTFTVNNKVDAVQHFSYSEDQYQSAQTPWTVSRLPSAVSYKKANFGSLSYLGSSNVSETGYNITVENATSEDFKNIYSITDPLPTSFYISPEDMQMMFDDIKNPELNYGAEKLTITISGVTIGSDTAADNTPGATVIGTDGNSYTLDYQYSGVDTEYSGLSDDDPAVLQTDAVIEITYSVDGTQVITLNGEVINNSDIAAVLDAAGVVITSKTKYTVEWDLDDDYILKSGESRKYSVYAHLKNTFMLLNTDKLNRYSTSYVNIPRNTAYVNYTADGEDKSISIASNSFNTKIDFSFGKNAAINGDNTIVNAIPGDYVDYSLSITNNGNYVYPLMPVTDMIHGAQVLLVPAEGNEHLSSTYGLTAGEYHGGSYYALSAPGTYKGIVLGGYVTDTVTVTQTESGFDTLIRWYLTDIDKGTKYIGYRVLVDPVRTGVTSVQFPLNNEAWLGDRQSHRLYAATQDVLFGTLIAFDKYIVSERGDIPENDILDIYSPLYEGESTTYRLTLTNEADGGSIKLPGSGIYDALPLMLNSEYEWTKDNVHISYVAAEGDFELEHSGSSVDDSWYISDSAPDWANALPEEDQRYLRWNDDVIMTIKGTVYIYVTLDMPTGDAWLHNYQKYFKTRLENTLNVYDLRFTVYHDLAMPTEAYLQKGVLETGANRPYNGTLYYCNRNIDSRLYYVNYDNQENQLVRYYIVLYNGGTTRLYLDTVQDQLPEGFSMFTYTGSNSDGYTTNKYPIYVTNDYLTAKDSDGKTVSPVWKRPTLDFSYDSEQRKLNIDFTGNLSYDSLLKKYYLNPNEGIKIAYVCSVGPRGSTEDIATNTVAMEYYDYLNSGLVVDDIYFTYLGSKNREGNYLIRNDGDCDIIDTSAAELHSFTGGAADSQWLSSEVHLQHGEVIPGITKKVDSVTKTNGTVYKNPLAANSEDTINWSVIAANNGTTDIINYTLTDVMNAPYAFTGDVILTQNESKNRYSSRSGYNADGSYTSPGYYTVSRTYKLFNIIRDENDLDNIQIKPYFAVSGSSQYTLTRGGEAVTFTAKPDQFSSVRFTVTVRFYLDSNGNEVMELTLHDDPVKIPVGGNVTLSVSTNNYGIWRNRVYFNNCYLTPNEQTYNEEDVSQGNNVMLGEKPSVQNTAQIAATYGYVTTSEKRVALLDDPSVCTSSQDEVNYIPLPETDSLFRYTNIMNNITGTSLDKFIMIDNLPQVGDHSSFAVSESRFSEFRVKLADDPNVEVYTLIDDVKTVITPDKYTVQYSDRTEFVEDDWNGTTTEDWYDVPRSTTRSFRLILTDNTETLMPNKASVCMEYTAKVVMADDSKTDTVTTDPNAGEIAWNSFGYHYSVTDDPASLEAAPLKVGVLVSYIPSLQKTLIKENGDTYTADKDESFRFLIYSGNTIAAISAAANETEIAELLEANNTNYTVISVTVPKGQSISEAMLLDNCKVCSYDAEAGTWIESSEEWIWNSSSYTLLELPGYADNMYTPNKINTTSGNSITFTYEPAKNTLFNAVNIRKSWSAKICKVDEAQGKPLAGAWFGLYSPNAEDAMSDDELGAFALKSAPEKTFTKDGTVYYLRQICESSDVGSVLFAGLTDNTYLVRELQAPGGYQLEKDVYTFSLSDADSELLCEKTVVNTADYELPETGGSGIITAFIIGHLLMFSALAAIVYINRRKEN